jgi:hypothetical protein
MVKEFKEFKEFKESGARREATWRGARLRLVV